MFIIPEWLLSSSLLLSSPCLCLLLFAPLPFPSQSNQLLLLSSPPSWNLPAHVPALSCHWHLTFTACGSLGLLRRPGHSEFDVNKPEKIQEVNKRYLICSFEPFLLSSPVFSSWRLERQKAPFSLTPFSTDAHQQTTQIKGADQSVSWHVRRFCSFCHSSSSELFVKHLE